MGATLPLASCCGAVVLQHDGSVHTIRPRTWLKLESVADPYLRSRTHLFLALADVPVLTTILNIMPTSTAQYRLKAYQSGAEMMPNECALLSHQRSKTEHRSNCRTTRTAARVDGHSSQYRAFGRPKCKIAESLDQHPNHRRSGYTGDQGGRLRWLRAVGTSPWNWRLGCCWGP